MLKITCDNNRPTLPQYIAYRLCSSALASSYCVRSVFSCYGNVFVHVCACQHACRRFRKCVVECVRVRACMCEWARESYKCAIAICRWPLWSHRPRTYPRSHTPTHERNASSCSPGRLHITPLTHSTVPTSRQQSVARCCPRPDGPLCSSDELPGGMRTGYIGSYWFINDGGLWSLRFMRCWMRWS